MKFHLSKKTLPYVLVAAVAGGLAVPVVQQALAQNEGGSQPQQSQPGQPQQQLPAGGAGGAAAGGGIGAGAAAAPKKLPPDTVVLTINEEKITAGQFEEFLGGLPPEYQQAAAQNPEMRRRIGDEMIKIRLLAEEARKRKLDQSSKVQTQLRMLQDQVLAGALASEVSVVDDKAVQEEFEKNKGQYGKLKARHILIRTPDSQMPPTGGPALTDEQAKAKAQDIKKRVAGGEDFAAIAKKESDDKGSGAQGGDLGTFGPGQMVPEFEKAAFSLKKDEVSEPVKTQFGYHVIQVQEIVPGTFDEAKERVSRELGPKKMEALVADLKKTAKTDLNVDYFGPPAPTAADPAGPARVAPAGQPQQ